LLLTSLETKNHGHTRYGNSSRCGVLQKDVVIILANGISLALLAGLVYLKLRQTPS
jgi:hypothetical protein